MDTVMTPDGVVTIINYVTTGGATAWLIAAGLVIAIVLVLAGVVFMTGG